MTTRESEYRGYTIRPFRRRGNKLWSVKVRKGRRVDTLVGVGNNSGIATIKAEAWIDEKIEHDARQAERREGWSRMGVIA